LCITFKTVSQVSVRRDLPNYLSIFEQGKIILGAIIIEIVSLVSHTKLYCLFDGKAAL